MRLESEPAARSAAAIGSAHGLELRFVKRCELAHDLRNEFGPIVEVNMASAVDDVQVLVAAGGPLEGILAVAK
jgi:hypothetical protein